MAQPKAPGGEQVPPALRPLVEQLAALHDVERERIISAARAAARGRSQATIRWQHLRSACGAVSWGGDAVADTRAIYDD
jgi:hypothetical protein